MAVPRLLDEDGLSAIERHGLLFVDYLRLCFRFGGFPRYEGQANVPTELSTLGVDVLAF